VLGDWAYVWTHLSIVVTPKNGGDSVTRAGNTLSILQKQNDSWVIIRDANMLTATSYH
jgi:ketosteroid isomerase-like protein